ncbi:photosynthesis system II assembly factor Ycf48 [Geitlerinema sp. PCC 7407]|uniref:photosynthesis system II assembly factor Ycf48 n=1 Tax=Geitlerinema sp. PCC 7407 TaxID=1173025 RepID=UPI00029F9B7A|nr:photosynthesis system II assembly factor Ycf48 [Geitlerinema sp. PCC 7407]AFY64826.1 Ycf48-like protein [Geitlerinema sp. PCC 7407]
MRLAFKHLQKLFALVAVVLLCAGCAGYLPSLESSPWRSVSLPLEVEDITLLDIAFAESNSQHGWLVGSRSTLLETQDGGTTWDAKVLDLDEAKYSLTSVSFAGKEGWVVGQPSLLLHTTDEGKSWSQVPLSEKLPGAPQVITALGPNSAELTTNVGAIYRTQDGGKNWKALVQEAVGVFRNISRSSDGKYVTVSARGNFYSTWEPGADRWVQHNRNSSRRLQNMGFTADGNLWLIARGGELQFTQGDYEAWDEPVNPEFSTSWGLLDLAYRTPDELWVTGGSANLLRSVDGGKTWEKDRSVEDIPSNFYRVVFFDGDKGFVLGQRGTLLKYEGNSQAA